MKHLFLILFLFVTALLSFGQSILDTDGQLPARFGHRDTIDQAVQLEVFFDQVDVDTVLKSTMTYNVVLQLGEQYCQYRSYGEYRIDSLIYAMNGRPTRSQYLELVLKYHWDPAYGFVHKYGTPTFRENHTLVMNRYRADDSTVVMNWQMHPDTLRVCGLLCHKATTHFRGHDWTAWWTEEVPIDAGPWKFHGLPGLILKAQDAKGLHLLEATAIRQPLLPLINCRKQGFRKVTPAFLRKEEKAVALNYAERAEALGMFEVKSAGPKRHFYSPYEEEE